MESKIKFRPGFLKAATLAPLHIGDEVVVFDTETTGVGENDRVIEFSAIRLKINED